MSLEEQKTILLVEDSVTYALAEAMRLGSLGYKVITANSGEEAVELAARDEAITLILMDLELGEGLDGVAAAKQILAVRHLPIIFITAHTGKEVIDRLKTITSYGVVAKNSGEFIMQSSIKMALELFEAHREVEKNISLLRAREAYFHSIADQSPALIWIANTQNAGTWYNRGWLEYTGRTMEQELGFGWIEGMHPDDRQRCGTFCQTAFDGRQKFEMEFRLRRADGTYGWVTDTGTPRLDDNGKFLGYIGYCWDITERKHSEEALRESENLLRSITDNAGTVIFLKDLAGRYIHVNRLYEELFHVANITVKGRTDHDIFPADVADALIKNDQKVVQTGQTIEVEERVPQGDGIHTYISVKFPIRHVNGEIYAVCGIATDITNRKLVEEQIYHLAFYDTLTQLPNRRLLNDRIKQAIAASKRSGHYCALMFMDLDNFKSLNDTQGHVAGDLLLTDAASRIASCVREVDTVARFGGDEFVVMLNELTKDKAESVKQATVVAEKIRNILAKPYLLTLQQESKATIITVEHHCSVSIGVVMFIGHESNVEDIVKCADIAMYKAKVGGGNSIHFYE